MSKYIEKIGLPSTVLNTENSTNYALLFQVKTHIINNNTSLNKDIFDLRCLLYFNVFSYTNKTFNQTNLIIRIKTSESQTTNKVFWTNKPTNFNIVYTISKDGTYNFYGKCNENEQIKIQLVEGYDGFVYYYYNRPLNITLENETIYEPTILPQNFGISDECELKINENNNGIIINTPVGGDGLIPIRDSSIPLGSPNKRFKGAFFTQQIGLPVYLGTLPDNLINGSTFFHAYSKRIVTYFNEKWYCNGEEITL